VSGVPSDFAAGPTPLPPSLAGTAAEADSDGRARSRSLDPGSAAAEQQRSSSGVVIRSTSVSAKLDPNPTTNP
jgi:hypothetical protein